MGTSGRIKPEYLAGKLLVIRTNLGYNMPQMAEALSDDKVKVLKQDIHRFEAGTREPSLIVLLRYARLAKISLDVLADDSIDLP